MTHADIILLIESQATERGIAPATFCRLAVGNNRLHRNLVEGKSCTIDVVERLRAYVRDNPPKNAKAAAE